MSKTEAIDIPKGSTKVCHFTITKNGVAMNITGYSVRFHLKKEINSGSVVLDKECSIINASAGTCSVTLSSTETTALVDKHYYYELRLVDGATKIRVEKGEAVIEQTLKIPS